MAISKDKVKSLFQTANERVQDFGDKQLPVGNYEVVQDECKLITKKDSDDMFVIQEYTVLEGELAGKKHSVISRVDHEVSMSVLFGMWRKIGYDTTAIDSLDTLGEYCDAIKGRAPRMVLRISQNAKNPQFVNTAITTVIEDTPEEAEAESAPASTPAPAQAEAEKEAQEDSIPEEPVALQVGMSVVFSLAGKMKRGSITSIEGEDSVIVQETLTKKSVTIPVSSIVELG